LGHSQIKFIRSDHGAQHEIEPEMARNRHIRPPRYRFQGVTGPLRRRICLCSVLAADSGGFGSFEWSDPRPERIRAAGTKYRFPCGTGNWGTGERGEGGGEADGGVPRLRCASFRVTSLDSARDVALKASTTLNSRRETEGGEEGGKVLRLHGPAFRKAEQRKSGHFAQDDYPSLGSRYCFTLYGVLVSSRQRLVGTDSSFLFLHCVFFCE
jgi:hypothetical protein